MQRKANLRCAVVSFEPIGFFLSVTIYTRVDMLARKVIPLPLGRLGREFDGVFNRGFQFLEQTVTDRIRSHFAQYGTTLLSS